METEGQKSESECLIDDYQFASTADTAFDGIKMTSSAVDSFSPKAKGVYIQYVKDSDDNYLVDGFFRENMQNRLLPPEINKLIAAYYLKSYSIRKLKEKLNPFCMEIYWLSLASAIINWLFV